jgi:hypothetical protein
MHVSKSITFVRKVQNLKGELKSKWTSHYENSKATPSPKGERRGSLT